MRVDVGFPNQPGRERIRGAAADAGRQHGAADQVGPLELRCGRAGYQRLGELVVDLGEHRELARGVPVHRGHPEAAERDVGGAGVEIVEHTGPRILRLGVDR